MDEKPDQIMNHIETQRDQLGRNLNELESRVKSATDWRVQFDKNPMLMLGVALGGGLLLGSMVGGSRKSGRSSWSSSSRNYAGAGSALSAYGSSGSSSLGTGSSSLGSSSSPSRSSSGSSFAQSSPAVREQRKKANETLDHIKAALIGFATAKVKEFMTEALPGFNQHLDEAQRKTSSSSSSGSRSSYSAGSFGDDDQGREGSGSSSVPGSSSSSSFEAGGTGSQASTRTPQSSNSPYAQQGSSSTPGGGMNI